MNFSDCSDEMEYTVTSAIAEASQMTFVRGQWVTSDCSGELHHCIVAPTLPVSGDYSAYNMWSKWDEMFCHISLKFYCFFDVNYLSFYFLVAANKDGVPGSGMTTDNVEQNPAYTISAALTYTAQLVNVLAFYLDVRLPRKQYYR
jgi:beclin 1-associated autophagy-related key regulator